MHIVGLPLVGDQPQLAGDHAARRHRQRLPQQAPQLEPAPAVAGSHQGFWQSGWQQAIVTQGQFGHTRSMPSTLLAWCFQVAAGLQETEEAYATAIKHCSNIQCLLGSTAYGGAAAKHGPRAHQCVVGRPGAVDSQRCDVEPSNRTSNQQARPCTWHERAARRRWRLSTQPM